MSAKSLELRPIAPSVCRAVVAKHHYSGTYPRNAQVNLGVYWGGVLEGGIMFNPPMDRRKVLGLVRDTEWSGVLELGRMAFSPKLPRNAESRALAVALRLLRKHRPSLEWVLSFADACQSGDGGIYRACGFWLTGINTDSQLWELPEHLVPLTGKRVVHRVTVQDKSNPLSRHILSATKGKNLQMAEYTRRFGGRILQGAQMRYIYPMVPGIRERLTVPIIPYSEIERRGLRMYRGQRLAPEASNDAPAQPGGRGRGGTDPGAPLSPDATALPPERADGG